MNRQLANPLGVGLVFEVHTDHRRPSFLHIRVGRMVTVHDMPVRAKGLGRERLEFDTDRLGHDSSLLSVTFLRYFSWAGLRCRGCTVRLFSSSPVSPFSLHALPQARSPPSYVTITQGQALPLLPA